MTNQPNPSVSRRAPKTKMRKLHQFIATGGKPKDFEGCQGVDSTTVPGYKGRKAK